MITEQLEVVLSAETSDFEKGMDDAGKALNDLANESEKAKGKFRSFLNDNIKDMDAFKEGISKAGEASSRILKTTAGAVAGVGTALVGLGPATAEYRNEMAKLQSAFESAGSNAKVAESTYQSLYRVLGETDTAVEAANHLGQLTQNEEDLAEWTKICQGVYATFGASLPIESLTEAANETAKTGAMTGSLADALNWAGQSEEEFMKKLEACNSVAEREKLIRETLSGVYDEAAKSYEKNASATLKQNEANAKLTAAMAKLGEATAPVMAMLTELGAEILADLAPYVEEFADKYLPDIKKALEDVGEKVGKVINFIADNWAIISTIGGVVLAIATAISVMSAGLTAYNAVMAITTAVSAPMIGIIAGIVAGIALLSAGIILAITHWDEITAAVSRFIEAAKQHFNDLVATVKEKFGEVKTKISETWKEVSDGFTQFKSNFVNAWQSLWADAKQKVSDGVNKIKQGFNDMKTQIGNALTNIKNDAVSKFESIRSTMISKVETIKTNITNAFNTVKTNISNVLENIKTTAAQKVEAIKNTFTEKFNAIKTTISNTLSSIQTTFSSGFQKITSDIQNKLSSMASTITNNMNNAKNAAVNAFNAIKSSASTVMDSAVKVVSNAVSKLKGMFNFKWELPKIKLPHFSIKGKFSIDPPSVPKISVDWYQFGGVFDSPTLFPYGNGKIGGLGENGAEAIVPLEKNTEWLDKIAERLNAKQSNTPIVLQVDGKVFAQTAIGTINNLTKQTGKLALEIM